MFTNLFLHLKNWFFNFVSLYKTTILYYFFLSFFTNILLFCYYYYYETIRGYILVLKMFFTLFFKFLTVKLKLLVFSNGFLILFYTQIYLFIKLFCILVLYGLLFKLLFISKIFCVIFFKINSIFLLPYLFLFNLSSIFFNKISIYFFYMFNYKFIALFFFSDLKAVILSYLYILISVAFLTLFERKILATIQQRIGPNVVGYNGFLQPFADALKLLQKEIIYPANSDKYLYQINIFLAFIFSLTQWAFIPFFFSFTLDFSLSFLVIYILSTLILIFYMFGAWAANSKYSFLGMERIMAQILSIEIPLGLIYLFFGYILHSYNFLDAIYWQYKFVWFFLFFLAFFFLFYFFVLAETNRHPIDLLEAESEIVSGYNTEYSGFYFILIYISEYANIFLYCYIMAILFFGGILFYSFWNLLLFFFIINFIIFTVFMFRAIVPRIRYDQLMLISWKFIIPFLLLIFSFIIILD